MRRSPPARAAHNKHNSTITAQSVIPRLGPTTEDARQHEATHRIQPPNGQNLSPILLYNVKLKVGCELQHTIDIVAVCIESLCRFLNVRREALKSATKEAREVSSEVENDAPNFRR